MSGKNTITFGEILIREKEKRKLSFKEIADLASKGREEELRISPSYLSKLSINGYTNPSIKNVLTLTEVLSLDIKEVIQSFGFENLVVSDETWKINSIDELIRNANIFAPVNEMNQADFLMKEYLDTEEKEILINIINNIFDIGICDEEDILIKSSEILRWLGNYRDIRIKKTMKNLLQETNYDYSNDLYGIDFTSIAQKQINKSTIINAERIVKLIKEDEEIDRIIEGAYDIIDKKNRVIIHVFKRNDLTTVEGITEAHY